MAVSRQSNLVVAICVIVLCIFIYAPIILFYLIKFHRMSDLMVIKKRYPKEVAFLCIVIILYYVLTVPFSVITQTQLLFDQAMIDEVFKRIMYTVNPLFNILIYCTLVHRCWHIVYDGHYYKAELNSEWKYHLNSKSNDSNFWLTHKKTVGNVVFTRKIMYIVAVLLMVPTIIALQACMGAVPGVFEVVSRSFTSSYFVIGFVLIIVFYIYTPCPGSDAFFIRKEFQLLAVAVCMHMLLYFAFLILALSAPDDSGLLQYVCSIGQLLTAATAYFLIAMVTVYYVRWKVYCEIYFFNEKVEEREQQRQANSNENENRNRVESASGEPRDSVKKKLNGRNSHSYQVDIGFLLGEFGTASASRASRSSVYSPNIYSAPQLPSSNIAGLKIPTLQSIQLHGASINEMEQELGGDANKKIRLHNVLTNEQTFEIFMQHLASEYSQELMLCFVEIIQWKRAVFDIYCQVNNGQMLQTEHCHHSCPLAQIVPWSCIMIHHFANKDGKRLKQMQSIEELIVAAKGAAHELHVKYVEVGSELEINIADSLRRRLHAMCANLQALLSTQTDIMELFGLFDPVLDELYSLANHSFVRLKSKPDWSRIVFILSKAQLIEPVVHKHAK